MSCMTSPKSAVRENRKYSNTSGSAPIGSASSEKGKPISPYSSLTTLKSFSLSAGVFMVTNTSVKRLMVSMSPPVVTHTISANGCVIAPATRLILSLLISPDGSIIPLSKSTFFMSSSFIFGAALDAFLPPALTKRDYVEIRQDK